MCCQYRIGIFLKKVMNGFGDRLKQARGAESQASFAKKLGISQVAYSRYESDQREPGLDCLYQIGILTGVSSDWLLGLSDGNERGPSVNAPNNSGAIAVGKNARATSGGTPRVRPILDCANCKYKRLADAFKAL